LTKERPKAKRSPRHIAAVTARVLMFPAVIAMLGYLWLSVARHGSSPTWITQLVLVAPVAFAAYWLLGWSSQKHGPPRRILLAITLLLILPALVVLFAVEPWQRAQMRQQNALFSNQRHLDSAVERHDCPDGGTLVVTPWLFITDGSEFRRLVELRLIPSKRTAPSLLLVRTTAGGELAPRQTTPEEHAAAAACTGGAGALEALFHRMAEGAFE
jgi:hypothetical protein